jgi:hypothetical protein
MSIGKIKFHLIERNKTLFSNGIQDEYDMVLTNDQAKIIVEVKQKVHPNDVKKVLKKIDSFKNLYPLDNRYQVYGAVAGLTMPKKAIELAQKYKIIALTQEGNDLKVLHIPNH